MATGPSSLRTLTGDPPVKLVMRCSARARRISLRVSGLDGRVTLTRPRHVSEGEALDFARSKSGWLRTRIAGCAPRRIATVGEAVPVEGVPFRILTGRPALGEGVVRVRDAATAGRQTAAMLKALARERLVAATQRHARALELAPGRITLRDTRSRWGSCTARGDLMYSWRLIMAPPAVLDYVAAHEVAHLVRMDHSPAFWAVVAGLHPGWRDQRAWLRRHGAELHAWRFDAAAK